MSVAVHTLENDINKKCILFSNNIIFMPIGKAGSLSVRTSCGEGLTYITKDDIIEKYMSHKKVAIVRNPFDRLVSAYSYFSRFKKYKHLGFEFDTFESFVKAVANMPDEISNCHYRSQVNLLSQDNNFLPDVVIDLKRIDDLTKYLPIGKIQHVDQTRTEHKPYQEYYTPELKNLTKKRYTADLNQFNYRFEG